MTEPMADNELRELHKKYLALTGRKSTAKTVRYLRALVLELEEKAKAGEDTRRRGGDARFNVSMSDAAMNAITKLVKATKLKRSEFVRQAIAFWAEQHDHPAEAKLIAS